MELLMSTKPAEFKLSKLNRDIDYNKVGHLAKAMSENNLLPYYPIVVDKDKVIIDGQHRFEAAKMSDSVIYYIVSEEGYDIGQVAQTNAFQSRWKLEDYIKHYASRGDENYRKLRNFSRAWNLSLSKVLVIVNYENVSITSSIKKGNFKIRDEEKAIRIFALLLKISKYFKEYSERSFIYALKQLLSMPEFKEDLFLKQIETYRKLLVRCVDKESYFKMLYKVYTK